MGKLVAAKFKVTEQELPDTNWRGTSYRYSSSQQNLKVKALRRGGRIPDIKFPTQ